MTPAIYSFVFRPKFVFWLAAVVALLLGGAVVYGLNTLHSTHQDTRVGGVAPSDTVLRKQVREILTTVNRIDSLSKVNTGKIDDHSSRLGRLEQNK